MMQKLSATALTQTVLIHGLILGARSGYQPAEKTRKLNFER
jgi:hypothetical protein